jgi:two-component system, OmpR family, sensor kinase
MKRLGLHGRLLFSAVGAVAVVLAALTIGFNIVLEDRLETDANSVLQSRASAELSAIKVDQRGQIVLAESPDDNALDSQIWVFEGKRALERPRASAAVNRAASGLAGGARRTLDAHSTRLLAVPVARDGRRVGTVVSGVSLRPYDETQRTALVASVIVALVALATVAAVAGWLISRALRPVSLMTSQAADWSERDLDRRFSLGEPHDELTHLAATLDGLLDRLAATLRHEQRFSAELSHELRTPLANVIAEAQFALRHARDTDEYRAGFEQVLQSATQMNRILDTLLAAARAQLDPQRTTSDVAACARAAIDGCGALAADHGIEIGLEGASARAAVDADLVERILAPLVENACLYGRSRVVVSVRREGPQVLCSVEDDGPGVAPGERETIFEPGRRGQPGGATATATMGAGLGLALARRLARTAAGDVEVGSDGPGGSFVVRLPAA